MMPSELTEWQALKKSLSRESFAAKFPYPFLLRRMALAKKAEGGDTGDYVEPIAFRTDVMDQPAAPALERGSVKLSGATVLPVAKKPQNPYPDRISVGRALNCDVVIRDASISKLHGHFRPIGPAEAEFVDRDSANGTKVNGTPVKSEGARVVSGDTIIFGSIAVQFLDAKRLWDLL